MSRPRILSGMRPTGALHLGNYLGALDNWVPLQDRYDCFFSIVDWHSLTTDYADPSAIRENVIEVATDWLAAGLDPARSTLFIQSLVPQHAELHLLLSMIMPVPWLERVPTYKEQQQNLKGKDLSTYGFLGYPLLQTADIIDLQGGRGAGGGGPGARTSSSTREIVRRFNNLYGDGLPGAADAAHRGQAHPGHRRAQDVEVVRQRDLPEGRTRGGAGRSCRPMVTDPARKRRTDPGDPDDLPGVRPAPGLLAGRDAGVGGRGLPHRRASAASTARRSSPSTCWSAWPGVHARRPELAKRPDTVWDVLRRGVEAGPRGGRGHHGGRARRP